MTFSQFYLLRPTIEAVLDANEYRSCHMTTEGKIAFVEAVGREAAAGYEYGLRGDSLVIHVNMMLGG